MPTALQYYHPSSLPLNMSHFSTAACCSPRAPCRSSAALLVILTLLLPVSAAFNIDTEDITTFRGDQANSNFGYSLSFHSKEFGPKEILIGAPLANRSELLHHGIVNSGALYRCHPGKLPRFHSLADLTTR